MLRSNIKRGLYCPHFRVQDWPEIFSVAHKSILMRRQSSPIACHSRARSLARTRRAERLDDSFRYLFSNLENLPICLILSKRIIWLDRAYCKKYLDTAKRQRWIARLRADIADEFIVRDWRSSLVTKASRVVLIPSETSTK